jgi:hypothetical protein
MGKRSRIKTARRIEKKRLAKSMAKNGRVFPEVEVKDEVPIPYKKSERLSKIANIFKQLLEYKMDHVLTNEIVDGINEFKTNGTEYHTELELPEYGRTLVVDFVNDKRLDQDNAITFRFQKIRVEGDDKINELNSLQESLLN